MYHPTWGTCTPPYDSVAYPNQEGDREGNNNNVLLSEEAVSTQSAQAFMMARPGTLTHETDNGALLYALQNQQQSAGPSFTHLSDQSQLVHGNQPTIFYPDYSTYVTSTLPNQPAPPPMPNSQNVALSTNERLQRPSLNIDILETPVAGRMHQAPTAGQSSFRLTRTNENLSPIATPVLPNTADIVSTSPIGSESSTLESPLVETNPQSNTVGDSTSSQLINLGFGSWRCSVCDQVFRRKQRALTHFAHNHGNTRMTCGGMCGKPHCGKSFASHESLAAHLNPNTVECPNCQRVVLRKNILRHQSQHCHS
ncbi:hypothetical protein CPB86DRAFT_779330 [Serendipita vermifera]|nr:hypothetical protein CPB86DRAFT_779330 [Serendipita vermifera]